MRVDATVKRPEVLPERRDLMNSVELIPVQSGNLHRSEKSRPSECDAISRATVSGSDEPQNPAAEGRSGSAHQGLKLIDHGGEKLDYKLQFLFNRDISSVNGVFSIRVLFN